MLREPSLVAFSGLCAPAARPGALAVNEDGLGDVEPEPAAAKGGRARARRRARDAIAAGGLRGRRRRERGGHDGDARRAQGQQADVPSTEPRGAHPGAGGRGLRHRRASGRRHARVVGERARRPAVRGPSGRPRSSSGYSMAPKGSSRSSASSSRSEPDEAAAVHVAADALAVSPHPGVCALAEDLLGGGEPRCPRHRR